jgi:hypothetical protein
MPKLAAEGFGFLLDEATDRYEISICALIVGSTVGDAYITNKLTYPSKMGQKRLVVLNSVYQ